MGRLTPDDFHLEDDIPHVVVGRGKGGKTAMVPLLEEGVAAARDYIALNAFGKWRTATANKAIAKAAAAAGLPTFTTHQIRHSFAIGLRRTGTDLADNPGPLRPHERGDDENLCARGHREAPGGNRATTERR